MGLVNIQIEILHDDEQEKEKKATIPNCWICKDEGVIIYQKTTKTGTYEQVAHCICEKGKKHAYKNEKSGYYVPCIDEIVDPEMLRQENIEEFREAHKDNIEILKRLQDNLKEGKE